jgi:hypothetical protein
LLKRCASEVEVYCEFAQLSFKIAIYLSGGSHQDTVGILADNICEFGLQFPLEGALVNECQPADAPLGSGKLNRHIGRDRGPDNHETSFPEPAPNCPGFWNSGLVRNVHF